MQQMNYWFHTINQAIEGIAAIRDYVAFHPHAEALLIILSAGIVRDDLERLLRKLDDELPNVVRAGVSEFLYDPVSDDRYNNRGICMNLMLSDAAHFKVLEMPCELGGELAAATAFAKAASQIADVKGVALYASNLGLDVTAFLEKGSAKLQGVPFFGAMAVASSATFVRPTLGDSFAIGSHLVESGFTAVVFSGAGLQVLMDYALGWRAVGREMEPVIASSRIPGKSCIASIDGSPAIDIYDKYLGVGWNENFVVNVCEFPLMLQRSGVDMCMVPNEVGPAGELYLSAHIEEGEKVCFSYGTRESVLGSARTSSDRMREFGSQALLMWLCGNRALFLGDEAHVEWDVFGKTNPNLAYCHGNYEIAWQRDGEKGDTCYGGVLNSALVAVGFREGEQTTSQCRACAAFEDMQDLGLPATPQEDGVVPLSYRVSRFFDVMTGELVHLQHNLEHEVEAKTRENESLMLHVVITLATAIDAKDAYTNGHSIRVATYARDCVPCRV